MQIKRIFVAAAAVAVMAAPSASASVAVDPVAAPAEQSAPVPRHAEMAAHHEAISTRSWQQAENAPVVGLVRSQPDGFDWVSALIGGSVPLALLLARPAVSRRRARVAVAA
jgi:opacity protein-like surface antigen